MTSHIPLESWFEDLSGHPIFSSPPTTSASSSTQVQTGAKQARKNTFGINDIEDDESADQDEADDDMEQIYDESGEEVIQRKDRLIVRGGKEVIVVVGREIRLMDLKEVKDGKPERYWVLRNPDIDFKPYQIALNPTNKLLVLVGSKQIGVIMLPALGSLGLTAHMEEAGVVRCKGTKIAPDIYKKGSRERIVKAKWHPWGEHGTSLLVLTDDTVLREFDTSHSSTQPLQAIPLHPSVPYPASSFSLHTPSTSSVLTTASNKAQSASKRKSVYTAEDVLSKTAVSFDLGKGEGEWGSLAIWGLMKNGDVWTICPFLPEFAMVPETYIETLNMYLGKKALEYRLRDPSSAPNQQASLDTSQSFSPSEHDSLGKKLAGQQKWARSLARQVDAHKSAGESSASTSAASLEQSYAVRPPRDGKFLKRQGPYMILPEPQQLPLSQEAGWGIEGVASDIIVLADQNSVAASQNDKELQGTGMNVIGIAWIDGRIDLCMEAQKVDAEWEADEVWGDEPLSTLVTFDSLDLGLLDTLETIESTLDQYTSLICNSTTFTRDPLDPTSVFVHHVLGVHWINFKKWKTALADVVQIQDIDDEEKAIGELWKRHLPSQCGWVVDTWSGQNDQTEVKPILGATVLADIELGYALLATSSDKTAAVVQLNEFADAEDLGADDLLATSLSKSTPGQEGSSSASYLAAKPYDVSRSDFDKALAELRKATQTITNSKQRLDNVSIEDLEAIGTVLRANSHAILEMKKLSGRVEGRADLQVKEVGLQLQRLKGAMRKVAELRGEDPENEDDALLGQGTGGSVNDFQQRYNRILKTQQELASRLGKVQGKLKSTLQPDLSDAEQAWQTELQKAADALETSSEERTSINAEHYMLQKAFESTKLKLKQEPNQVQANGHSAELRSVDPTIAAELDDESKHIQSVLNKLKSVKLKYEDV